MLSFPLWLPIDLEWSVIEATMKDELQEELNNIRTLLASPDLDYVKTGLELSSTLCMMDPDLGKELIGPISIHLDTFHINPPFQDWPHIHYIALSILGEGLIDQEPTYFKYLNLSASNLTELPENLSNIRLKSINLSKNDLADFPFQLLEIEGLRSINLQPRRGNWRHPAVVISISTEEMSIIGKWIMDDHYWSDRNKDRIKHIFIETILE